MISVGIRAAAAAVDDEVEEMKAEAFAVAHSISPESKVNNNKFQNRFITGQRFTSRAVPPAIHGLQYPVEPLEAAVDLI